MVHAESGFENGNMLERLDEIDIRARFVDQDIDKTHPDSTKREQFLQKIAKKWPYLKINEVSSDSNHSTRQSKLSEIQDSTKNYFLLTPCSPSSPLYSLYT